jgi:hypothetical protein
MERSRRFLLNAATQKRWSRLSAASRTCNSRAAARLLYFVTPAWATSGAIHVVDTTNGEERYLFPGNDLKLVKSGEYKDCLLVQQHRYFVGSGSYDWYWLLRTDGKEVGPVGEDTSNFEATYGNE